MNNFDYKKYLVEGNLFKEDISVEEMEEFAEGRGKGA